MPDKDERSKEVEKTEFPVDARPLIGSFLLLFLVFIGLCVTVYFQNSSESFGLGNILLALAFGFAAYVQRGDSFRVGAILIGGAIICFFVFIFGGESEETIDPASRPKNTKTLSLSAPEGLESAR
jgi:hypothetical protein